MNNKRGSAICRGLEECPGDEALEIIDARPISMAEWVFGFADDYNDRPRVPTQIDEYAE